MKGSSQQDEKIKRKENLNCNMRDYMLFQLIVGERPIIKNSDRLKSFAMLAQFLILFCLPFFF